MCSYLLPGVQRSPLGGQEGANYLSFRWVTAAQSGSDSASTGSRGPLPKLGQKQEASPGNPTRRPRGLCPVCVCARAHAPPPHIVLLTSVFDFQNQLSGNLLRKFKNSNGWQKLWVVFTNFCLFFYKSHQVSKYHSLAVRGQGLGGWGAETGSLWKDEEPKHSNHPGP